MGRLQQYRGPRRRGERRARLPPQPTDRPPEPRRAGVVRRGLPAREHDEPLALGLSRDEAERAPPASRDLTRIPDLLMADHCRDFSRSQLIRAAAARAGDGLPGIEPGMPRPAGTGLSRRSFVLRSSALAMSVYGASRLRLGAFEEGVAKAAE